MEKYLMLFLMLCVGCDDKGSNQTVEATCGNGVIEGGEACDGSDLGGKTCEQFDMISGHLKCTSGCEIDTLSCVANFIEVCGNGVKGVNEACDGGDFGGKTCVDFGGTVGKLACTESCEIDTKACESEVSVCGNGKLEGKEECEGTADGFNLAEGVKSCVATGAIGGSLGCDTQRCVVDYSKCAYERETGILCNDRKDNDNDGLIDCADYGCRLAGSGCDISPVKRVLFDAAHGATAGNADWVIAPNGERQNEKEVPEAETDWAGRYSSLGVRLFKSGKYFPESLPSDVNFTFGDKDSPQDLSHFDILVLPEPNTQFDDEEFDALWRYLSSGGSIFYIADHIKSDRDRDGHESLTILGNFIKAAENKPCPEVTYDKENWHLYCENDVEKTPIVTSPFCMVPSTNVTFGVESGRYYTASLRENNDIAAKLREIPANKYIASFQGGMIRFTEQSSVEGVTCKNYPVVRLDSWETSEKYNDIYVGATELTFPGGKRGRIFFVGDSSIFSDITGQRSVNPSHKDVFASPDMAHAELSDIAFSWLSREF